jgi:hypothetical protein
MNAAPTVLARRPLAAVLPGLLLGSAVAVASLAGCGEDPKVADATEFARKFDTLSEDYRKLSAGRSLIAETGPVENTSDLAGLLGSLNQLSGGTSEQTAAASLLRAKVAMDLGTFEAGRAARAEVDSRQLFELVGALSDAAAKVETLSQVEPSLAGDRERLTAARASAEAAMGALRGAMAGLREPIDRLGLDRERREAEIAAIDGEIASLRRDAAAAGARAGFPLVEEAAELNAQAITLRTRSALDRGELELRSDEFALAESTLVASEGLAGSAQSGLKKLEDFSATLDREAKAGRELVTTLRTEAETILAKVDELRGETLDSLYAAAATAFDEAGAAADSATAAGREAAGQFKLGSLRARGAMIQSRIAGLDAEAALRDRLAEAGSLFGGAAKAKPALEAIAAERATLLEEAKGAYGEAMAMIDSMGTEQAAIARTRASLEASLAMLEGKAAPAAAGDPGPGGMSAAAGGGLGGFATPKALVDFVNSIDRTSMAGGMKAFGVMHASDRAAKAFLDGARSMLDAISPFTTAAEQAYGAAAVANAMTNGMGGMGGGPMVASLADLSLVSEDVDSAVATAGGGETIALVKVNGSWFIDANELAAAMGGEQGQAMAAAGPMMAMMKPAMTEAALAVAGRIEAGEFTDAGAAVAAFNEAMQAAIAKSMGGLGGGGFGGGQP